MSLVQKAADYLAERFVPKAEARAACSSYTYCYCNVHCIIYARCNGTGGCIQTGAICC